MDTCVFCQLHLEPSQNIILENEHCLFLQLTEAQQQSAFIWRGCYYSKTPCRNRF